ncbi:14317_t:CDS:2 [Acaulospora colombiana]|uniref:14317_t:CDS:1 n=1 Tax=Acaulospora colombiana TaxID=27376 RepID=A0ACA9L9R7_9GLOM|nr:14317_t:CDS:2 [Acaulospora colombiana]
MEKLQSMLFRPKIAEAVRCSNFTTAADILHHNERDLAKKLNLSGREVSELVNTIVREMIPYPPKNALMLLKDGTHRALSTGDKQIDKIIGGGILSKGITEIVGESSVGKTQLCLQLCLTVQLPEKLGGLNGGAVYISTEGNFHLRLSDLETQRNVLDNQLSILISSNNIRLIVIDSVTANFRTFETTEIPNFRQRALEISQMGIQLKEISDRFNAPVVCVNQVSDNFIIDETYGEDDSDAHYEYNYYQKQLLIGDGTKVPALGLMWSSVINARIVLSRPKRFLTEEGSINDNGPRTIALMMAPHAPRRFGEYYIDGSGVHGLVN